jgi:hypothetical protein
VDGYDEEDGEGYDEEVDAEVFDTAYDRMTEEPFQELASEEYGFNAMPEEQKACHQKAISGKCDKQGCRLNHSEQALMQYMENLKRVSSNAVERMKGGSSAGILLASRPTCSICSQSSQTHFIYGSWSTYVWATLCSNWYPEAAVIGYSQGPHPYAPTPRLRTWERCCGDVPRQFRFWTGAV